MRWSRDSRSQWQEGRAGEPTRPRPPVIGFSALPGRGKTAPQCRRPRQRSGLTGILRAAAGYLASAYRNPRPSPVPPVTGADLGNEGGGPGRGATGAAPAAAGTGVRNCGGANPDGAIIP